MSSPNQRLLLAKYLYMRGSEVPRHAGVFDPGLSVSLFQDAVEMAVLSCAATVGASPKDKSGFSGIWEAADKELIAANKSPLPMKIQMDSLNKARVNFKHAGHVPETRLAETCRTDAGEFLARVATEYFGLNFSSLSLVSFVLDGEERQMLEAALELAQNDDARGALERCSDVLSHLGTRRESFYGHAIRVAMPNIDRQAKAYVDAEVADLRGQLRDLEGVVFSEACGVSAMDFLVVRTILPRRHGDQFKFERHPLEAFSMNSVRRCIELLAQYSIGLSRQLQAPDRLLDEWGWSFLS